MHHMLPRIHLDLVSLNTYTDGVTLHTCPFTKRGVDDFTHWTIMYNFAIIVNLFSNPPD